MKKLFVLLSLALSCISMNAEDLKTVVEKAIAHAAEQVAAGDTCYNVAPVVLDKSVSYTLSSEIALGLQKMRINGCGATVTVTDAGQITTETFLNITGVNFDCENATKAPVALSATPSSEPALINETCNQKVVNNPNRVTLDGCNFRELKQSLFYANKQPWALWMLEINDCVIQLNHTNGDPVINWYGSSTGAIKNIVLTNNTIYNVVENTSSYFIRYGNASNAQPQKIWGNKADGSKETSCFVMKNNTLCQTMSGKDFANNFPNTNVVILDWKSNIFYNVFRLQKIGQNNTRDFQPTDNITWSSLGNLDSTDKSKFATELDPGFVVPTTALDFANISALKANFGGVLVSGDPRWYNVMTEIVKAEGATNQVINMSNTLQLVSGKYSVNGNYPWIIYNNSGSNGEVRRGGIYVSINPTTFVNDGTFTYMVDDAQQWLGTPKVEVGYAKDADNYFSKLISYSLAYNVKDVKKVELLLTGGGSNTNVADVLVLDASNKAVIKSITSEAMPGKSNKNNDANTKSTVVTVNDLDPAKAYIILVAPSLANTTVEVESVDEDGDKFKEWVAVPTEATSFINDINVEGKKITNIKNPAVYVAAVRITGSDDSAAPICHVPGEKYAGTNHEVVKFSNYITTAEKAGAAKSVLDEENNNWMKYVNLSSVCDNGQYELSKGGHWASIDYVSGNPTLGGNWTYIPSWGKETTADFQYIFPDANPESNLGSPKVEMGYTKLESGDLLLQPKNLSISVKEATRVDLLLTGAGSNTNAADIIVKNAATGKVVKVVTTETMAGKSNKDNAANTNSKIVSISLDPAVRYTVSVFPSAQYTQVEMQMVDEDGDSYKEYVPFTGDWTKASTYTAKGLSNVKAPAVFVYAAHIYGTDLSTAPGDALGDATGINDINAAETTVKAKKYVKNGRIVIESANGTYSVTGAQLK